VVDQNFLKVHFGQMQITIDDLGKGVSSLTDKLADLERQAAPLVATWQGDAQDAYHQRQQQWTSAANELKDVLNSIRRALSESMNDYAATESSIASSFR
jgi:early secretory antigenic target protein ESAT-6